VRVAGAIDIGGTRTKLGVVAEDGRVVSKKSIPTTAGGDPLPLVAAIASELTPILDAVTDGMELAPDVGVSVAGFLDAGHAAMHSNANLPALCGFPLKRALEERMQRVCHLEVDSNASTLAEYRHGAGRGSRRLLGITIGTGLGGGVMLDGQLLRHTGECAGDLGHVIVAPEGRRCTCGARGCLEAMVCSAALSERAGGSSVREIIAAARSGDRTALAAIEETARWLALGLASLTPLFTPDTIVVGGGVAGAGDLLLGPLRTAYRAVAAEDVRDRVRIVGSDFGGWEGLVGAASVVFSTVDRLATNQNDTRFSR
jgi:glucokinase